MPRRRVRSVRHRHGAVRPQFWPYGDWTSGRQISDRPYGYFGSIRVGALARLILVYGLLLFAVMVAVALLASAF